MTNSFEWLDTDSVDMFRYNKAWNLAQLKQFDWISAQGEPTRIEYNLNSTGLRDTEIFKSPDSAIALGCSCTLGVGMPDDDIWVRLIESDIDRKVWNLGVSGGSLETAFRLLEEHLAFTGAKHVFLQTPSDFRRELVYDTAKVEHLGHWTLSGNKRANIAEALLRNAELAINKKRVLYAILALCSRYDAQLYIFESSNSKVNPKDNEQQLARDLQHPGYSWHRHCRDVLLEQYSSGMDITRTYKYLESFSVAR